MKITEEWLLEIGFEPLGHLFDGKPRILELDDNFFLYYGNTGGEYHVSLCAEDNDASFEIGHFTQQREVLELIDLLGEKQ